MGGESIEFDQEYACGAFWYSMSVRMLLEPQAGVVVAHSDISARKTAEDRLRLFAREIEHRSRNVLGLVTAILRLTPSASKEAYVSAVEQRISALARANSLLATNRWASADFEKLVRCEVESYISVGRDALSTAGPPIEIAPEAIQPVAMVFHELATNALKYGALSHASGRVGVSWDVLSDGRLEVCWTESGAEGVLAPSAFGFGTELITNAVLRQLHGDLAYDWRPTGLRFVMTIDKAGFMRRPAGRFAAAITDAV